MLSDCYSLMKWLDLKEERICHKFCFNHKKIASETYRMLIKAFYDDTMSRVQTNGIRVLSHQTLARGFECSGPPSLSQTGDNAENTHRVRYEECIYLMMFTTF